jgi:RHS repeat-associated protein
LAVDEIQTDGTKVTSYLMADRQGSTRVLMNAAGAVTSRHDYFPFGEEIGAGTGAPGSPTGMRTAAQGYSAADNVRQRYADTRLDDATGLDHTLWRKLETRSGRWTTPDPYGKSLRVVNPQTFNRYAYVHNDPVNFVDPSGLDPIDIGHAGNVDIPISFDEPIMGSGGGWLFSDDPGNLLPIVGPLKEPTGGDGIDPQNLALSSLTTAQAEGLHQSFDSLLSKLNLGQWSNDCRSNVIDKLNTLPGFNMGEFVRYLAGGFDFYDGTTSTIATAAALAPSQILQGTPPPTIAGLFAAAPSINALTSANLSASRLTVFFNPSAIDLSSSGLNGSNQALLFHEALHGFGSHVNQGNFGASGDSGLLALFRLNASGPSSQITAHIKNHCF